MLASSNKRGTDQQVMSDQGMSDAKRSRKEAFKEAFEEAFEEMKRIGPIIKEVLGTDVLELDSHDLFLQWILENTENQPANLALIVVQYVDDKWLNADEYPRLYDEANVKTTKALCSFALKNKPQLPSTIKLENLYDLYIRALVKTKCYDQAAQVSFEAVTAHIQLRCHGFLQSVFQGLQSEGKHDAAHNVNWYMYPDAHNRHMYDEYVRNQAFMCTSCRSHHIDIRYSCGCCISCQSCWLKKKKECESPKCESCDQEIENVCNVRIGQ